MQEEPREILGFPGFFLGNALSNQLSYQDDSAKKSGFLNLEEGGEL